MYDTCTALCNPIYVAPRSGSMAAPFEVRLLFRVDELASWSGSMVFERILRCETGGFVVFDVWVDLRAR